MTAIAIITVLSGIVIFVLSLPLISRNIPMNGAYGIRIPAAFESEQRWYDINAYGGRRFAAWSWVIVAAGIVGFFVSPEHKDAYVLSNVVVTLLAVMIPAFQVSRWSGKK